jgi:hypothetical protein
MWKLANCCRAAPSTTLLRSSAATSCLVRHSFTRNSATLLAARLAAHCSEARFASARRPTTAAASVASASETAAMPTEALPGEWVSPITSELITSSVSGAPPQHHPLPRCL